MRKNLFVAFALLLLCFLPIFILGEDSFIIIHDNLDSELVFFHLLKASGCLLPFSENTVIPNIFNGLNKIYIHSEFSLIRFLFYLFPPFWAYVVNAFLVRLIGIWGILFLINGHFKQSNIPPRIQLLIAFCFGMLPVYTLYGISVMGQPFLLWAFLNLAKYKSWLISVLVILLFPFYAHFALTAPFILVFIFCIGLFLSWRKQKILWPYFVGVALLFLSYILANSYTLHYFLTSDIPSHRESWTKKLPSLRSSISRFVRTFISGQYHSAKLFGLPIILISIYAIAKNSDHRKKYILGLVTLLSISLLHSIYLFISVPLEPHVHFFTTFQFDRFTFLMPLMFFLLLILVIGDKIIPAKLSQSILIIFAAATMISNVEISKNIARLSRLEKTNEPSFKSYYAQDLFSSIKSHIGKPQRDYKVVSLGIAPSIAQFNGFHTLDSYQNNYPLSYKMDFYEIIESELEKNKVLHDYFYNWGNRCYLFSSELFESCNYDCRKKNPQKSINNLAINVKKLQEMGGKYIFSTVVIKNANELNLSLEKTFQHQDATYDVHLYRIDSKSQFREAPEI